MSDFYTEVLAKPSPDISFTIYNKNETTRIYKDDNNRFRSNGTIHNVFEMHNLMSKSLSLISPKLLFAPDFPDYMLPEDDPKFFEELPTTTVSENGTMPHHRNDLYQRDYTEYKSIDNVPTPTITWGTVRQEPGGNPPFRGTQEIKPRSREFIAVFDSEFKKHYNNDNKLVQKYGKLTDYLNIEGQVFDNLVQYNLWARTAWEAEELVDWFINYMTHYTGMFREAGIVQMYYKGRVRDDTLIQIKNRYHLRSVLYYYRTETIDINTIHPINAIKANLNVKTLSDTISVVNSDDFGVNSFYDKLLSKWHKESNA